MFLFNISINLFAGNPDTDDIKTTTNIHGKVYDIKTGEKLASVLIQVKNDKVYTDLNGEFSIDILPGQ